MSAVIDLRAAMLKFLAPPPAQLLKKGPVTPVGPGVWLRRRSSCLSPSPSALPSSR